MRGPRDPDRPVVCLDETSKQLIAETRAPMAMQPGRPARAFSETRNGGQGAARFRPCDARNLNAQGGEKSHCDLLRLRNIAAPLAANGERRFEYRDTRRMLCFRALKRDDETFETALAGQNGDDRRSIDERHTSPPRSS